MGPGGPALAADPIVIGVPTSLTALEAVMDLAASFSAELEVMARRRQLARWVNTDQLAVQITTACISASMAWAAGGVADTRLRAFAEQSVGLMLLGAARGAAREELETRLRAAQTVLSREDAPPARTAARRVAARNRNP